MKWDRSAAAILIRAGQWITIGLRVPPRCEATCLPHWKGVSTAHAHAAAVVRGRELRAPRLQPAVQLDERELLLGRQRDAVLHRQLVERAGERSLHARAVVTPDVDDERVVELAHLVDRIEHAADVPVRVLLEPGVDLHLARVELFERLRQGFPGREGLVAWRQLRVRRDHAECLLASERLLPERVPPLIELALVLVGPLLRHVVRRMAQPVEK